MFTIPVGLFGGASTIYRPTSVADTPASGTITNSANAYDTDPNSYADFVTTENIGVTYSVYTFPGATVLSGKTLYASWSNPVPLSGGMQMSLSIDAGASYPFSTSNFVITDTNKILSQIRVPDGATVGACRLKFSAAPIVSGRSVEIKLYDVYIQ